MVITPFIDSQITRLFRRGDDFWGHAEDIWHVAESEKRRFPPAIYLPGQIDHIKQTVFGSFDDTIKALSMDGEETVGPTIAARFRNVLLQDGVLYKNGTVHHLAKRKRHIPTLRKAPRISSGAIFDSWVGLRYFGNWLMDDCETYRLAEAAGQPVTLHMQSSGHRLEYEQSLAISPVRTDFAHFEELILFQDLANNSGKRARAADRRRRLLATNSSASEHPGVFLMRGRTGDARLLANEEQIAEGLSVRHGLRVIHIMEHSVESLVKACAGAKLLIGVEGSQLVHALAVMSPGTSMLALMPPDRVTAAMKLMTDRLDMNFAMLVGKGSTDGFEINPSEIEATLDLLP